MLVVFYDSKLYPKYKEKKIITIRNEKEVDLLNAYQYISAEKLILFRDSKTGEKLLKNLKKFDKDRLINKSRKKVSEIGNSKNKVIIINMKITVLNCNLSFSKLLNQANNIPNICRDATMRTYDKEWETKLKHNIDMFLAFKNSTPDLTTKELQNGYKEMYRLAKAYWHGVL